MGSDLNCGVNYSQALSLKQRNTYEPDALLYPVDMKKHYIRKWRKHRKLTLQKLADRMEKEPGVPLMSFVNLGKIERGEQSPSLDQLYAIAEALDVSVTQLLRDNPEKEGEVIDLMSRLSDDKREMIVSMIKAAAS
jgi:transcriptional regulator with XRE-family HTH domain